MSPFACDLAALDAEERDRHAQHRKALRAATRNVEELRDGYRLHLGAAPETFLTAADWIVLEHRCCPFLDFNLELTADNDISLSVTGPADVKAFLSEAFSSR